MAATARRWRTPLRIIALVLLIVAANMVAHELADALDIVIRPRTEDTVHRLVMTSAVVYAVLMAIPFVPGVEVGLAMIAMLGTRIVPLVYLCTVAGLGAAFLAGRLLSLDTLGTLLDDLHLRRAAALLRRIAPMDAQARLAFLASNAPTRLLPLLLRHRYLALAVVLNLPGNFLIGGGGGIALVAGVSGLFSTPGFLLTMCLAVAPVPLALLLLPA